MAPTKSIHVSESQQNEVLDYMEQHPLFAHGKLLDLNGREPKCHVGRLGNEIKFRG
jgi:hypothetical protein